MCLSVCLYMYVGRYMCSIHQGVWTQVFTSLHMRRMMVLLSMQCIMHRHVSWCVCAQAHMRM